MSCDLNSHLTATGLSGLADETQPKLSKGTFSSDIHFVNHKVERTPGTGREELEKIYKPHRNAQHRVCGCESSATGERHQRPKIPQQHRMASHGIRKLHAETCPPPPMRGLGPEKWLIQQVHGAKCKDSHHLIPVSVCARPDSTQAVNESQPSEIKPKKGDFCQEEGLK